MDEISAELRAAVAVTPPSRIDLDNLIRTEGRRRRQRAWIWSGTGAAATLAAVLVMPALVAGGPARGPVAAPPTGTSPGVSPQASLCIGVSPKPTGPQPPVQSYGTVRARPTESAAAGVVRLTGVWRSTLRSLLPTGVHAESMQSGCTEPQIQYQPRYREYEGSARLRRGRESGFFLLRILPTSRDESRPDCAYAMNQEDCTIVRHPDGTAAVRSTLPAGPGQRQLSVLVLRPDGTSVLVITNNFSSGPSGSTTTAEAPLLTLDQLDELARAPGLTLYP